MISESTSPPKTILSVLASPKVSVPPSNLVVPLTVRSPPTCRSLMKVPMPVKVDKPDTFKLASVDTPATFRSSSSDTPSTSNLPLASILPAKVETPDTLTWVE